MSKKNKEELITYEIANEFLRYEAETGRLFWKERDSKWFKPGNLTSELNAQSWNKRFSNKEAFNSKNRIGYYEGRLNYHLFLKHRIIWLMHHKEWPKYYIDHIDGNPLNNHISNLRDVKQSINTKNSKKSRINTSGNTGVHFAIREQKWVAQITVNYKNIFLGYFLDKEKAIEARKIANQKYYYSERHGEDRPNE